MSLQTRFMFEESSNTALRILQPGCTVFLICLAAASRADYKSSRALQNALIDST